MIDFDRPFPDPDDVLGSTRRPEGGPRPREYDSLELVEAGMSTTAVSLSMMQQDPEIQLQELSLVGAQLDAEQRTVDGYRPVRGAWGGVLHGIHESTDEGTTMLEQILATHPDAKFLPIGQDSYRVYTPLERET